MQGCRQHATTSAEVARACATLQQTVQKLELGLTSGQNVLLKLSIPVLVETVNAFRLLTAPSSSDDATLAAQSDAATATALVQFHSCTLRVLLQQASNTHSQLGPEPSSSAADGSLRTLLLWHGFQTPVAGAIRTYLQQRPANDCSFTQSPDPRCVRQRMAVALLRTDTLQAYCMVMAALLEKALGPDASDQRSSTLNAEERVLTLLSCLVSCTVDALELARLMCNVTKRDVRALACLRHALHASGLLAHACHVLLRLADWRQAICHLPDQQAAPQQLAFDSVLAGGICAARSLVIDVMSRPELALAALAPAVQYFAAAQLVEAAAAVDGGPTHGLRAPGVMRLLEARCATEGHMSHVDFKLYSAVRLGANILTHPLYPGCQEQQQRQAPPEQGQQQQQHMLLGASSGAAAAPDQRGDGGLPPALFGPTESFDLLVRSVDCMFREVEAAGQQAAAAGQQAAAAGQQAAAGGGAPAAKLGPSLQQHKTTWLEMSKKAYSELVVATAALDGMAPRRREQRLPRLWRALNRAVEGAASADWFDFSAARLLQLAAGRLVAASDSSPSAGTVDSTVTTVNDTVNTVNGMVNTVNGMVNTVNDTVNTVNGTGNTVNSVAQWLNGTVRVVSSEARAAHQQGFVRAWAAALRWILRTATGPSKSLLAMPLVQGVAAQVSACWFALREAGALPSELAQVAAALRKLVAAEAAVPSGENPAWLEAAASLLYEQLMKARVLVAAGALPPTGQQPRPGAEPVPGVAIGVESGCGSSGSCSPGAAQEQQQQLVDRAVTGACAALALLPTLSRRLAALLREQVQPGPARRLTMRVVSRVRDAALLRLQSQPGQVRRLGPRVVLCVCCAMATVTAWAQQVVLDGVCGIEPRPAAAAATDTAAEAHLRGLMPQPQAPQPSPSGSSATSPCPEQAAGAGVAASALHPAGRGTPAPPTTGGAAAALGWRRFAAHGLALGELAEAGLQWAAALWAPPGEEPLSKEELDELGSEEERAAAASDVAQDSCTILMLLEALDPGSLNQTLTRGGSAATAGSDAAAPAAGAAAAVGPSTLHASLEALARREHPVVHSLLDMAQMLGAPGGSLMRPAFLRALTMVRSGTCSRWLPPLDAAAALLPAACSNPLCASPEGPCEAQGQGQGPQGQALRACGRCGGARYCSRDCQVAHWRAGHKAECEEAQAAAARAHAAGGAQPPQTAAGPAAGRPC